MDRRQQTVRRCMIVTVTAVALLLIGVACSKGASGPASSTTSSSATPQPPGTPSPSSSSSSGTGGSIQSRLEALGREWTQQQAKITYQVQIPGASSPSALSALTLFWKPPSSWRMDVIQHGQVSFTMIATGGKVFFCTTATRLCLAGSQSLGVGLIPFLTLFSNPKGLEQEIAARLAGVTIHTSSQSIAGQQASCFTASGTANGQTGSAEWCFSSSGLLLLIQGQSAGASGKTQSFRMQATQVSQSVSGSDFSPPFPVHQLPTLSPTP